MYQITSSYRFDSFIDFNIEDMRTFSGDVYRVKVSGGSDSTQGDFPVLLDTVVDIPELLVDTSITIWCFKKWVLYRPRPYR